MRKINIKWFVYVLICAVLFPLLSVFAVPTEKVKAISNFNIEVETNKITSIKGDFTGMSVNSYEDCFKVLDNFKKEFGFNSSVETLKFNKKVKSVTGSVYRFNQYINDMKVYASEVIINVNNEGRVTSINCSYYTNISAVEECIYTKEEAENVIRETYNATTVTYLESNVLPELNSCVAYIYEVHMLGDIFKVFVCSSDLKIIKIIKATASATSSDIYRRELPSLSEYTKEDSTTSYVDVNGKTVTLSIDKYVSKKSSEYFYILGDQERAVYITHGQNQTSDDGLYYASNSGEFNDVIAVRAYDYIMKCYDFYLDSSNFGISIDGLKNPKGEDILLLAIVHYDNNYENAAFYLPNDSSTTGYFYFGDGNTAFGTGSFVNGLDVVGHEYQHCISDSIVQLEYFNESGAICEAYSDIFGSCIEGYELSDANFWRMGEDIYLSADKYFRDMSNPSLTGCSSSYENLYPLCTNSGCTHTNCDNGGVHYNSTLMTYATYIMYQLDPDFFTKTNILKLWYQTLTKLSEKTTFVEFAEKMIQSAEELNFSEENILNIEFAFASVDLPGYSGVKIWNDYSLQYLQGSGTISYPYLINSVADLASVAYYVNSGTDISYASARYQVNVDLDLKDVPWVGIGTMATPFNGVFNGGGKTISGLNIVGNENDQYAGLFNYTGESAYIYDVKIGSGTTSSLANYAGAIAGLLQGSISGCSSDLNIIGKNIGGLVGLIINASGGERIVNSFVTADLEGDIVGGLASELATPLNLSVNLHLSGYVTSSYTTGVLTGKVVGGLIGRANSIYLANVITTSTLQGSSEESIIGGLVGELAFKNIKNSNDSAIDIISNMILSAKVVSAFNIQNSNVSTGLLIGKFIGNSGEGTLYIENTFAKKQGDIKYCSNELNSSFVKIESSSIVTDNIFEGKFDFDNEKYYKNVNNWTIIDGIESFDLVSTYKMNGSNAMPIFITSDFWLNHSASGFDSGYGTEESPFIIKTPEQLALMASLVGSELYNNSYSAKYYKLGADIDLSGKIWVGIGATRMTIANGVSSASIYPFTGVFDGAGYSILNMSAISAYSVSALNSTGTNYKLTEYLPSLFGVVSVYSKGLVITNSVIKNTIIENVNNRGGYAAGVISKVYTAVNLDNVSVNNGNVTSNFIAGGLIGSIDGLYQDYHSNTIESSVTNCDTHINVSGRIVGGVVGYVTNASTDVGSTLNVINYLNRGKIVATGEEIDSSFENGSSYYYRPVAGSVVGINLIKNLTIINTINLGSIISYNYGGYVGGFIGAIGVGGTYTSKVMNVMIDGCKQIGKIYYVFDNSGASVGSIIGGTHRDLASILNLTITQTTYTNQTSNLIAENNMIGVTTDSQMVFSNDNIGEGVFDIYSQSYYENTNFFNQEYLWSQEQQSKLFISVTFRNINGEIIDVIYLDKGQTSIDINDIPIPKTISTRQYEYVFVGWDKDLTNITQSLSVYAEYDTKVREYKVTYLDEDGEVIETKQLTFGSSVNQEVEAPQKKSGLLFEYEFIRWGEEGQTVTGEITIKPIYQRSLTFVGKVLIMTIVVVLLVVLSRKNKKQQYN